VVAREDRHRLAQGLAGHTPAGLVFFPARASTTRPPADGGDVDRYYAGVELDQLTELVTGTHWYRPRYQPATKLYPWVDLLLDSSLRDLVRAQPRVLLGERGPG
jgi:hypothetical protein